MQSLILDYQSRPLTLVALDRKLINQRQGELLQMTSLPVEANIDRSGVMDFGLNCKVLDPMPAVDHAFDKSFTQVMDEAAQAIVALGRPFTLYWSGGLDSTGVAVALLRAGVTPEQMTVAYTCSSVSEYAGFFEKYLAGWGNLREMRPSVFPDVRYDEEIVTGELGDQIFGSIWVNTYDFIYKYTDVFEKSWVDHIGIKYADKDGYTAADRGDIIELYRPFVAAAPFPILNVYDFLWWLNFACKWQHVAMRMAVAAPDVNAYLKNTHTFYRGGDFQQWAMNERNHRTLKTSDNINTYKLALRSYIVDFTHDQVWVDYKKKLGSLPMKYAPRRMMVLTDGTSVKFAGAKCDRPDLYNAKYGDRFDYLFRRAS